LTRAISKRAVAGQRFVHGLGRGGFEADRSGKSDRFKYPTHTYHKSLGRGSRQRKVIIFECLRPIYFTKIVYFFAHGYVEKGI
jgi:hypothetical protein